LSNYSFTKHEHCISKSISNNVKITCNYLEIIRKMPCASTRPVNDDEQINLNFTFTFTKRDLFRDEYNKLTFHRKNLVREALAAIIAAKS